MNAWEGNHNEKFTLSLVWNLSNSSKLNRKLEKLKSLHNS